jgi:hypothetical protein
MERKTPIDEEGAATLIPLWEDFIQKVRNMEKGLVDFLELIAN